MSMLRYTRNKFRKESISAKLIEKKRVSINVIKLRDDEPSGYYCLDGIFI